MRQSLVERGPLLEHAIDCSVLDLDRFMTSEGSYTLLRNELNHAYFHVSARLKMPFLIFINIRVFRPEGQIWNPVRRDTTIYVRKILNASRICKIQMNSSTICSELKRNCTIQ